MLLVKKKGHLEPKKAGWKGPNRTHLMTSLINRFPCPRVKKKKSMRAKGTLCRPLPMKEAESLSVAKARS